MPRPPAIEGVGTLPRFVFESGDALAPLRLGYARFGQLNAARDNLLLVLPGTGNTRLSAIEHIGPGRAYDTDRYCVVCTDALGGGLSSRPSEGAGARFPRYTIADLVRAQASLVRDALGLGEQPIAVLAGASMGAFQVLDWLVRFPGSVRDAVLMVPAWRAGPVFRLATERMFEFITRDAAWNAGCYTRPPNDGLHSAGRHYFPWTVSDAWLNDVDAGTLQAAVDGAGAWFAGWDAWDLMRRYQASSTFDLTQGRPDALAGLLARVRARTLVLPCRQDRLLGVRGAHDLAAGIAGSVYREIDSTFGHLAWRAVPGSPQTVAVTAAVRAFLGLATDR